MPNSDEPLQTLIFLRLLEKEKAALVEEKEQLVLASQELLSSQVDNQLPFDPNDPKVKELEEWECSVSRSVIVEVGFDISLISWTCLPTVSMALPLSENNSHLQCVQSNNFRIIPATDWQNCSN